MRLPDREEGVAIQVVALNGPLRILEDDLHVSSVSGVEDARRGRDRCAGRRRFVIDTVVLEHLVGDAVISASLSGPWGLGRAALAVRFHRNDRHWFKDQAQSTGAVGSSGDGGTLEPA
ncbi:hypothetical protein B296_00057359 [Ensete ventricosum]|uniref:Uncharacterized protein n=1 Tax=Ensete ventricosum TaxID=4639 RepID=A0A426XFW9_ENSVE|nr:hypothetical protein B296_00057359 [Ensete ventricosum]